MNRLVTPRNLLQARGFSLVEMMIAMVLGLLVIGAAGQYYLANKASFLSQTQNGQLQETGRFAMELIGRDVRMAGYNGCGSRMYSSSPTTVISYLNSAVYPYNLGTGVFGYEAAGTAPGQTFALTATYPAPGGTWTPMLPSSGGSGTSQIAARAIPGTDVLVVRSASPYRLPLIAPYTSGSQIFVALPPPGSVNEIVSGDIVMVTDCLQMQIFQATNVSTGATRINVVGSQGGSFEPGNARNINERGPVTAFVAGSEIARIRSYTYFVGQGDDGTPALFREFLDGQGIVTEELISHVESFQAAYGVDDTGNMVVDRYIAANAVSNWNSVLAVRVGLLVRSPDEFADTADTQSYQVAGTGLNPVDDRRQRRVFETTIALRNRML